ncbi:putative class V chitinase [Dactylonectria estremocensis]|uniref:chitinase n=1 Tax=Dactylonectria estremocensis TaxID=1079267 RepID=A0A9P9IR17_9HYPO|nr:putative class V chitinase [Dactylonectria estremocensis]
MKALASPLGRLGLLALIFLLLAGFVLAQDPECSASTPCKAGGCSKFGFCGYGKDYCHEDCDPGGFGSEFVEKSKCPLNVCCSKHGFCGWTEEFCGDKEVGRPQCDSHTLERVVGYYEGWTARRPCNPFMPEQILTGVYMHLNFAFATVDPDTFEVRPASSTDTLLYRRLTSLKERDPDLKAFINSLVSMMSTYGFDGVDLDWEYPAADGWSGREEDFEDFPKFIANLKKALKSTGRDEVSLTLPASMWYLKHFDIVNLEKHVDFFNNMSYDLYGTWDKGNKWVGPYLNAHTNLTEIKQAMDLLWRNNINPNKVVLGTGFYGRAFTATSSDCLAPGCMYESGAPRQRCSNEISVMIQSEIVGVMERTGGKPILNEEAAMKADFARKQCMSGIMDWAVSQDVSDGTYSKAIGKAAARKFTSLPAMFFETGDDAEMRTLTTKHPQCKSTNCGESCPSGWVRMMRKDDEARDNEYMVDGSYCARAHNNGKCDPTCPDGTVEFGSLKTHYNNSKYQAVCCTTGKTSMELHDQCGWTGAPMCMSGSCSSGRAEVARSPSGSGNAVCNVEIWNHPYGDGTEDNKWDDCQWYDNLGPGKDDDKYCCSGCLRDCVRVAMDAYWNKDGDFECARGARAKCCISKHQTVEKRDTSQNEILCDALESFLAEPICSEDGGGWTWTSSLTAREVNSSEPILPPQDSETAKRMELTTSLERRQSSFGSFEQDEIKNLVYALHLATASDTKAVVRYGYDQLAYLVTCHVSEFNDWVGGSTTDDCECDSDACCPRGGDWCVSEDSEPDDAYGSTAITKRGEEMTCREEEEEEGILSIRATPVIRVESEEYYPATNNFWYANHSVWNNVYLYPRDRCFEVDPQVSTWTKGNPGFHYEHEIEQNTLARFFTHYSHGTLPSGARMRTTALFNAFGSRANTQHAVFTAGGLNLVKMALWRQDNTANWLNPWMTEDVMSRDLRDVRNGVFAQNVRNAIIAINYMRDPVVWNRIRSINFDIRDELRRLDDFHYQRTGTPDYVVSAWDEFFRDQLQATVSYTQRWVRDWVTSARNGWRDDNDEDVIQFLALVSTLLRHAEDLEFNYDELPN